MKKKIGVSVLAALAMILTLAGCAASGGETKEEETVTVEDAMGREVAVPRNPQKIVSLLASDVEILYAIGAGEQIAGVGEYCDYPEEASEKNGSRLRCGDKSGGDHCAGS